MNAATALLPTERQVQRSPLDASYVVSLVRYDPDTGKLYWRERHDWAAWLCLRWNRHKSGKEAFTRRDKAGYCVGHIDGRGLLAHRVAWACHYGEWPKGPLDHINQNKADNRITNLRLSDPVNNGRNVARLPQNTSGATGICRHKNAWQAQITVEGKNLYLGRFETFEAALRQRKNAERFYGFSSLHGRPR